MKHVDTSPTDLRMPHISVFCAKCGSPLVGQFTFENGKAHKCDGNYGWLDETSH